MGGLDYLVRCLPSRPNHLGNICHLRVWKYQTAKPAPIPTTVLIIWNARFQAWFDDNSPCRSINFPNDSSVVGGAIFYFCVDVCCWRALQQLNINAKIEK